MRCGADVDVVADRDRAGTGGDDAVRIDPYIGAQFDVLSAEHQHGRMDPHSGET